MSMRPISRADLLLALFAMPAKATEEDKDQVAELLGFERRNTQHDEEDSNDIGQQSQGQH